MSDAMYIKPDGMRILYVYLMLEERQIVNYNRICEQYDISYRTFMRIITSIRDALFDADHYCTGQLVFNKTRDTYELIKY